MICPKCGGNTSASSGPCPVCGAATDPAEGPTVAAALLTPPPDSQEFDAATIADPEVTRLLDPARVRHRTDKGPYERPLQPGQSFGTRYTIVRQLGAGGMGAVYQAWDQELSVVVALKVIRPEISRDPFLGAEMARRFKRELLLAREVTHKNVVRIHDLGEIEGIKYITMSYVAGADLASVLRKEAKLPVPRALRIAKDIAAGLLAAHDAGVVHRDLKPANIMVDAEDTAQIMDFGIARSTARSGPDQGGAAISGTTYTDWRRDISQTIPGAVVGTMEYMAPEQAKGQPVDHRADIYAFGLILYDMLLGSRLARNARTTAFDELTKRMEVAPPSPRSIDASIPERLDRVITRCLQPDAAARYETTAALVADLNALDADGNPLPVLRRISRRQFAAAVVAVLALLAGTWWLARSPVAPPQPAPTSVLIADFDVQGVEALQGTAEEALAASMEGAPFITVFPRRDARTLATKLVADSAGRVTVDTGRLISQREGIKLLLAGAVAPVRRGFEVKLRAVDPANGNVVTEASRTAADTNDILRTITLVAEDVRDELGDTTPESVRQAQRETFTAGSLEAAREYSVAQDLAASYKDEEALQHYKRAVDLDPNFGRAYSGSAYSASRLGRKEEADELWKKALSVVDRMTEREKYRTLGLYYGTVSRNYDKAIENYSTLVKLYPADGAGHNNLALAYFSTRNFAQALEEGRRALEIYPRKLLYRGNYALYAMYASDFKSALDGATQLLNDEPTYYPAYLPVAVAALTQRDFADARDAYNRMAQTGRPGATVAAIGIADAAMYEGNFPQAVKLLRQGIENDKKATPGAPTATKYVLLGEAYRELQQRPAAVDAVNEALKLGHQEEIAVPAAETLLWAGRSEAAAKIAQTLQSQFEPHRRAYGKLIEGEIAAHERKPVEAIEAFLAALKLTDLWLVRFNLGVLYVEAGRYAEALSELDACQKRLGEAAAIFLDDVPTMRYTAPLPYWLARAQEGLGMKEPAAANYKTYLSLRNAAADPLAVEARRRVAGR